jgi:hypothetical protein
MESSRSQDDVPKPWWRPALASGSPVWNYQIAKDFPGAVRLLLPHSKIPIYDFPPIWEMSLGLKRFVRPAHRGGSYNEAAEENALAGRLPKGLRAATFLSIPILVLAGGCDHPRSTPEDTTAASYEVLHTLIGKQVTVRGKFSLRGKFGPLVLLDNQQVVYLVPTGASFTWGEPYPEMEGKLVTVTGTLSFYHAPKAEPADRAFARAPDYFYLEAETAHVRLISP